jgi:hypothetical protein
LLTTEEVLPPRQNIRPFLLYDLYIAGQPVVSEQFLAAHCRKFGFRIELKEVASNLSDLLE